MRNGFGERGASGHRIIADCDRGATNGRGSERLRLERPRAGAPL